MKTALALLLSLISVGISGAALVNVSALNNVSPVEISPTTITEGSSVYTDRQPGHILAVVPSEIEGAEFIRIGNSDKTSPDYVLSFELTTPSTLYILLDNRLNNGLFPPTLPGAMNWVTDMGFADTSIDVSIDEGSNGSIDQTFSIYSVDAPAGVYQTFAQDDGGSRNMYVIAARQIPEPSTLALLVAGTATVALRRRK